jgi:pimeloyl-ACP methyl ester carboxylesterase
LICGYSGGGKLAGRLALHYPDVFRGSISMCGTTFYRAVPITDRPREVWPATVRKPAPSRLSLAKRTHRYVLFTGEEDANRLSTLDRYDKGFRRDRFRHVLYLEAPGHGHKWADAPWLEKALAFLDGGE